MYPSDRLLKFLSNVTMMFIFVPFGEKTYTIRYIAMNLKRVHVSLRMNYNNFP